MKNKLTKFKPLLLPLGILIASLLVSSLMLATDWNLRLGAYGVPLVPAKFDSNTVKTGDFYPTKQKATSEAGLESRSFPTLNYSPSPTQLATATPTVSFMAKKTLTPTTSLSSTDCRRDCTTEECPEGLVCMAIASDEGRYSYQCMNPKCTPFSQNEKCQCVTPTPMKKTSY